jgi:predicted MFS family arabinose efflux permease
MPHSRWLMLALLFWLRAAMGFQFQSVASIGGPLAAEFGISASALGALIGLYILPGFVVALPSGALASRLPDRATASAGLIVMAAGSIVMALAPSYAMLCAGRLLAGIGYALYTLVITKMVADWFTGREMFTAMGVMLASWPCGIALGLAVQPALAVAAGRPCSTAPRRRGSGRPQPARACVRIAARSRSSCLPAWPGARSMSASSSSSASDRGCWRARATRPPPPPC